MELFPTKDLCYALATLMKEPSLLEESKIRLDRNDFYTKGESKFYQIIFAAINNLYLKDGMTRIEPANIDEYLSNYPTMYETFEQNGGVEFLYKVEEIANPDSYLRYATRIRKFSLLRDVEEKGFSLEAIYEVSEDPELNSHYQTRFEQLSIDEIIEHYERIVNDFSSKFGIGHDTEGGIAGQNGMDLLQSFLEEPQYGVSTCGKLQNTIFRGHQKGSSMLRSATTNAFKSRTALAEATDLSISKWYNWKINKWESKGNSEKVLFISTEMEQEKLEPTIWAYISGVKEENIRDGAWNDKEYEVIKESIEHLNECSNFFIEYIPKFDPQTINSVIKKYAVQHEVDYVYFDYIHLNFEIMIEIANKTKGMSTREDMMLSIFAAGLEELAKEYNFHLSTSTQLNGNFDPASDSFDSRMLRGAKSMADKFTKACIMNQPTEKELKQIEHITKDGYRKLPNMVWHIYKNRESKFKGRLYLYIDFDTMRMEDLFMTDNNGKQINVPERILESVEVVEEEYDF